MMYDQSWVKTNRLYESVSMGQIHVYYGEPIDESDILHTPVLMLQQSPNSAQVYHSVLPRVATDRKVIAPDTPGFGMSDAPAP